jgi:hypothetical protein
VPSATPATDSGEPPVDKAAACVHDDARALVKMQGFEPDRNISKELQVIGWSNHYNATYQRCYVVVDFLSAYRSLPKGRQVRQVYWLLDAYENASVAACSDWIIPEMEPFCEVEVTLPAAALAVGPT